MAPVVAMSIVDDVVELACRDMLTSLEKNVACGRAEGAEAGRGGRG